jgi:hypothetical protein
MPLTTHKRAQQLLPSEIIGFLKVRRKVEILGAEIITIQ